MFLHSPQFRYLTVPPAADHFSGTVLKRKGRKGFHAKAQRHEERKGKAKKCRLNCSFFLRVSFGTPSLRSYKHKKSAKKA
jgi:hypothetical protein